MMEPAGISYFEQTELWKRDFDAIPAEKERIGEVIAAIPADVRNVLDAGCGNGFFLNTLAAVCPERFDRTVGLDFSEHALQHVKVESVRGSITHLPFGDKSFDLVTCLEVLEHLPHGAFEAGLRELERVSGRYLLVTVPNQEDLFLELVMCEQCNCCFNRHLHVRSFCHTALASLFPSFELVACREIGPTKRLPACGALAKAAKFLYGWPIPPGESICPQCGYRTGSTQTVRQKGTSVHRRLGSRSPASWLRSMARSLVPKRSKKKWLLGLYQRHDGSGRNAQANQSAGMDS